MIEGRIKGRKRSGKNGWRMKRRKWGRKKRKGGRNMRRKHNDEEE